jgi:hypothetical protein
MKTLAVELGHLPFDWSPYEVYWYWNVVFELDLYFKSGSGALRRQKMKELMLRLDQTWLDVVEVLAVKHLYRKRRPTCD